MKLNRKKMVNICIKGGTCEDMDVYESTKPLRRQQVLLATFTVSHLQLSPAMFCIQTSTYFFAVIRQAALGKQ
jgi:hypothetical protein